jgi:hypothetical protein
MADSVAKGDELFKAAQKKLKSFSFFGESPRSASRCFHAVQGHSTTSCAAMYAYAVLLSISALIKCRQQE